MLLHEGVWKLDNFHRFIAFNDKADALEYCFKKYGKSAWLNLSGKIPKDIKYLFKTHKGWALLREIELR